MQYIAHDAIFRGAYKLGRPETSCQPDLARNTKRRRPEQNCFGLMASLLDYFLFLWVLSEVVGAWLIPRLRQKGAATVAGDKGSQEVVTAAVFASILGAFYLAKSQTAPTSVLEVGLALMALGIVIRQYSILVLGRFFTLSVKVASDQKVITKGPYRFVRHPSYTGLLLAELGVGLALGSWEATILILLVSGAAVGYRVRVEEGLLVSELGEAYALYRKKTKRLIPFIF